jgi:hypothetical protein
MAKRKPGEPDRQISPDNEFFKAYGVGCVLLVMAFFALAATLTWIWLR